jgi:hypothetical protein
MLVGKYYICNEKNQCTTSVDEQTERKDGRKAGSMAVRQTNSQTG